MVTTGDKAIIDTNVLLRANNPTLPLHVEADRLIKETRSKGLELWISRQIIREYLSQVTRPNFFAVPMSIEKALQQIDDLQLLFNVADETADVTRTLLDLVKTYPTGGKQIHDANIVATMLVYGIETLLTQNVADMKRFSGKVTILPLEQGIS